MKTKQLEDLKTEITQSGQRWYDKPVYQEISKVNPIAKAVAQAFERALDDLFGIHHYERTRLQWIDRHPLSEQERIDLSLGAHPNEPD